MLPGFGNKGIWVLTVLVGAACIPVGYRLGARDLGKGPAVPSVSSRREARLPMTGNGVASLSAWRERIESAGAGEIPDLARGLVTDPRRDDLAFWTCLLARWSATDAKGMIAFLEANAPVAIREKLLETAWYAWGASDPDVAIAASGKLPSNQTRSLLMGLAEVDVRKAVEFAKRQPSFQDSIGILAAKVTAKDPQLAAELKTLAIYDGSRASLERAQTLALAETDPAAAIALARSTGIIGYDPVPAVITAIANRNPEEAVAQIEAMPSNRTKALSTVALAGGWAAKDPEAALAWVRGLDEGPVRRESLLAAAQGGAWKPEQALDLLAEAGWTDEGDFFSIRGQPGIIPSEKAQRPDAHKIAISWLRQWSEESPGEAAAYARAHLPPEVLKAAGIQP